MRTARLICIAVALVPASLPLMAQVPPGATPGGALPRVESAVRPAEHTGELLDIPRVADRPSAAGEGPHIVVKSFRLHGAADHPERDVTAAHAAALLNAAITSQPAQGFTLDQLQDAANKVTEYYREHGYILTQAFIPAQHAATVGYGQFVGGASTVLEPTISEDLELAIVNEPSTTRGLFDKERVLVDPDVRLLEVDSVAVCLPADQRRDWTTDSGC